MPKALRNSGLRLETSHPFTIYPLALFLVVPIRRSARFLLPLTNKKGHPFPGGQLTLWPPQKWGGFFIVIILLAS